MSLNIVHVASTPLVGAPAKIAAVQRSMGFDSIAIYESDYPEKGGLAGKFVEESLKYKSENKLQAAVLLKKVQQSEIVHVHNYISADLVVFLKRHASGARYVYQTHSPLREGPLYVERYQQLELPFEKLLTVAQYQPRHYPQFIPVPNFILSSPFLNLKKENEVLRVMYSPTHNRGGRWNSKYCKELEDAIAGLVNNKKIEVITPDAPLHPLMLTEVRKTCHVTIDEIATGAYHQVSLEGLCAGNVVINRADYFSKAMLALHSSGEMPPFYYADFDNIFDVLSELSKNCELVNDFQKKSYDFFKNYLDPQKLIVKYNNIYNDLR